MKILNYLVAVGMMFWLGLAYVLDYKIVVFILVCILLMGFVVYEHDKRQ